ncbi:hypothetical protein D3C76_771040 [compost metagenome]
MLVPCQCLLANVEAPPFAVTVAKAQLALHQLAVTALPLALARAVVVVGIVGVQEDFPEVLAHLLQFSAVVAQRLAQMVVAEDHSLADHVLHVKVIGHGPHDVGPEAFALLQRQLDELAAGDIGDAQDHGLEVVRVLRQAQHQPQVLVTTPGVLQLDFQFKLLLLLVHRFEDLIADGAARHGVAIDQQVPHLLTGVDVQQLQGDLIDLGDAQFLQQLPAQVWGPQPGLQLLVAQQLSLVEQAAQARHVEDAQGHAGAFENLLVASATFVQLALATAHVQQDDERQHGKGQAQQAFADEGRQQFLEYSLTIEQAS